MDGARTPEGRVLAEKATDGGGLARASVRARASRIRSVGEWGDEEAEILMKKREKLTWKTAGNSR